MSYNQSVPTSCLVAGYVKQYNLIPIEEGTTAFNCTIDTPSWKEPASYGNNKAYSYSEICDYIDTFPNHMIKQLEDTYSDNS